MLQNTIYVGDVGTKIIVDVGIPANDIMQAKLIVRKPDGTIAEWIATPVLGTQTIEYVVQEGDFNIAGKYQLQAYIETNGWKGHGTISSFEVKQHLM